MSPEDEHITALRHRRRETLRGLGLLDLRYDPVFDDVVQLASAACDAPIAQINLVDDAHQWTKSSVGLDVGVIPMGESFCLRTVEMDDVLLVEDAATDIRFRDNPHVTGDPNVRFYAGVPLHAESGQGIGALCVIDLRPRTLDTAALEQLRALARLTEAQLNVKRWEADRIDVMSALLENSSDIVAVIATDLTVNYVSPAAERVLGFASGQLRGRSALELVHPDDHDLVVAAISKGEPKPGAEVRLTTADGGWMQFEAIADSIVPNSLLGGVLVHLRDVTAHRRAEDARRSAEARLVHQALHDPLTGLPNRILMVERLTSALSRARRSGGEVAVLFCDLDRFKVINDSLGHAAGDHLLVEVAAKLTQAVRATDTVARIGGDEFVVVAEPVADADEARVIAARMARAVGECRTVGGTIVNPSVSIGIAVGRPTPDRDVAPDALIRDADIAMYQAKSKGRARAEIYDDDLRGKAMRHLRTEQAVLHALEHEGLIAHYQPIVSVATGEIVGAEALARCMSERGDLIMPNDFIPVAEDTGLIMSVDTRMLGQACRQAKAWEEALDRQVRMSINVSARQLARPDLPEVVGAAVGGTGIDPSLIALEITETALLEASLGAITHLPALKEIGVRLGVDDFGTGYSSLGHLKRFPLDFVKIDRSFTDGLGHDSGDDAIVAAVVGLGRALGLKVVAEGVETAAQLERLSSLGCDEAQGFLLGRPLSRSDFDARLHGSAHALAGRRDARR